MQEERTEQNVIDDLRLQITNPVSASTFVSDELRDSPLLKDDSGYSGGFPVGSLSASSVCTELEESTSTASLQVTSDSRAVLLGECEESSTRSRSMSTDGNSQNSSKSQPSEFSSQTVERKVIRETCIRGRSQHEESSGPHKKSAGEFLEEYYRQRLIRQHEERQRQSTKMCQQDSNNDHSSLESGQSKSSGWNDANLHTSHHFGQTRQRWSYESSLPQGCGTSDTKSMSLRLPGCSRLGSHSDGISVQHHTAKDTLQSSQTVPRGPHTPPGPCPDDSPSETSPGVSEPGQFSQAFSRADFGPRTGLRIPSEPSLDRADSRSSQQSVNGRGVSLGASWPGSVATDPRLSGQQQFATTGLRTPLGMSPGLDDGSIILPQQARRGPRTPPGPGPHDDGLPTRHLSGIDYLQSSSNRFGQKVTASIGIKGDCSDKPQPPQLADTSKEADSSMVLKIINTAKLKASASQTSQPARYPLGPQAATGSNETGGLSSPPTHFSTSFMALAGDQGFSLYSGLLSPAKTFLPAPTPSLPIQEAPEASGQPLASGRTPPSDQPAENDANQNMELLIQKLQVFVERSAAQAASTAKLLPSKYCDCALCLFHLDVHSVAIFRS